MPRIRSFLCAVWLASGAVGCASKHNDGATFGPASGSRAVGTDSDATVGSTIDAPFGGNGDDGTTSTNDDGGGDEGGGLHFGTGAADAGMPCPATCDELRANCGVVTDTRCGGTISCGQCDGGVCGAVMPNVCAIGMALAPDGGLCTPKTCADVGANCGAVSNGCGGLLQCGTCDAGASCGIGDAANVCAVGVPDAACPAQSCAQQGIFCGMAGDGCGNAIDCGPCASPNTCGGGGQGGLCGAPVCKRIDCAAQGISCGPAGDGCGGPLDCGNTCSLPQTCGGGTRPGQCGCQGVCALVPICTAPEGGSATTTTLTGVVMDPGAVNPLYNVLVYIPNDPSDPGLGPFPMGTTCDVCGANAAGSPLVTTHTGTAGTFTLSGVPVGKAITLVIQLGHWRRQFQVDVTNPCGPNTVTGIGAGGSTIANGVLTMPKNSGEGDIPLTAIVTGNADAMECVFWKMGVDATEFTNPGGAGRIQLMTGSAHDITQVAPPGHAPDRGFLITCNANQAMCTNACPGACTQEHWGGGAIVDPNTPSELVLFQNNGVPAINPIGNYDLTVLSCQDWPWTAAAHPAVKHYTELVGYANGGGRIFVTHYSYDYLKYQNVVNNAPAPPNPFLGTANWGAQGGPWDVKSAFVDVNPMNNPKGAAFAAWLANPPSALSPSPAWMPANTPTVILHEAKSSVASVVPPTQQWMYMSPPDDGVHFSPNLFTFNTPIGAANTAQCGRGLFSDFHVTPNSAGGGLKGTHNVVFPAECGPRTPMSAQEKVLEFMLFDLSSCVQPYKPICTPTTCAAQGIECGPAGDGCGGALDCNPCPPGQICGAGGPGKCGAPVCTPKDCKALGYMCGPAANGCGGLNDCGPCPIGQTCGGGGKPGVCGQLKCTPIDCAAQNLQCGPAGDGCGNTIDCGPCTPPQVCGGGGPGKCGAPQCTPRDCASQGIQCGPAGDGCGNQIDCGPCPAGQICGFSGPGKCGGTR
jgi:hypothetical protein